VGSPATLSQLTAGSLPNDQPVPWRRVLPGYDQAALIGSNDRLSAALDVQFGENPIDMGFHRRQREDQLFRNIAVGEALCDEAEHGLLAIGEFVEHRTWPAGRRAADVLLNQPPGQQWRQQGLPGRHLLNSLSEPVGRRALEKEAGRPAAHAR